MSDDELRFKNILDIFNINNIKHHNINKLLYFNPDQLKLLSNNLRLVVLASDFGSGKKIKYVSSKINTSSLKYFVSAHKKI